MHDNQRQTHWAYVAGIMDADGCFMISRHKRKTTRSNNPNRKKCPNIVDSWAWTYLASVKISQVDSEAIDFIMKLGYGTISTSGIRKSRPNSRAIIQWGIRKREDVKTFLENVIPHLKIKKDRAEFLLEYCNTAKYLGGKKAGYFGLDDDELNYREESYVKMREFNGNKVAAETKPSKHESVSDSPTL